MLTWSEFTLTSRRYGIVKKMHIAFEELNISIQPNNSSFHMAMHVYSQHLLTYIFVGISRKFGDTPYTHILRSNTKQVLSQRKNESDTRDLRDSIQNRPTPRETNIPVLYEL